MRKILFVFLVALCSFAPSSTALARWVDVCVMHTDGVHFSCRGFELPGDLGCEHVGTNPKYGSRQSCTNQGIVDNGWDPNSEGVVDSGPFTGSSELERVDDISILTKPSEPSAIGLFAVRDADGKGAHLPAAPDFNEANVMMVGVLLPGQTQIENFLSDSDIDVEPLPPGADFGIAYAELDPNTFAPLGIQIQSIVVSELDFNIIPEPSHLVLILAGMIFQSDRIRRS